MSDMKTLKDIIVEQSGGTRAYPMIKEGKIPNTSDKIYLDAIGAIGGKIREAAREWRDALREALGMASKKDGRGYYNNMEVVIEGVIYEASTFEDDEAKPIIKFINQFFNLEDEKVNIPFELKCIPYPVEHAMELKEYNEIVKDGKREIIKQLGQLEEEIVSETFPYKTKELRSGVEYKLSNSGWLIIYGIEVIEGTGVFKMDMPAGTGVFIFSFVANGKANLLSPGGVLVPPSTTFAVVSPNKEELKYRIKGAGYNNPKIEEAEYKRGEK